jgi:hypothetical protein
MELAGTEIGHDDRHRGEDREHERIAKADESQPQVGENPEHEHADDEAADPAQVGLAQAHQDVARRGSSRGGREPRQPFDQWLGLDRGVDRGQQDNDDRRQRPGDAHADRGNRPEELGRVVRVTVDKVLDLFAGLVRRRTGQMTELVAKGVDDRGQ